LPAQLRIDLLGFSAVLFADAAFCKADLPRLDFQQQQSPGAVHHDDIDFPVPIFAFVQAVPIDIVKNLVALGQRQFQTFQNIAFAVLPGCHGAGGEQGRVEASHLVWGSKRGGRQFISSC